MIMAETTNSILQKLDGLEARFEEVSTLITDPDVIADQQRFVKLTKEYKDLGDIMDARKRYIACLNGIREAKDILANEDDPEMKEMAREELAMNEELQPKLEEEIKIALIPKDPGRGLPLCRRPLQDVQELLRLEGLAALHHQRL